MGVKRRGTCSTFNFKDLRGDGEDQGSEEQAAGVKMESEPGGRTRPWEPEGEQEEKEGRPWSKEAQELSELSQLSSLSCGSHSNTAL